MIYHHLNIACLDELDIFETSDPNVQKKFIEDKNIYFLIRNSIINNNKYSKFKYLKNFIVIIITLLRILERNGFRSLVKFIFFNNNLFLKSIYHGFKKI